MEKEYLQKFDIMSQVEERLAYLSGLKASLEREIVNMPKGKLLALRGKGRKTFRYYVRENPKDKMGKYLDKSQTNLRNQLAKKKYYETLIKEISKECLKMKKLMNLKPEDAVIAAYEKMSLGVRQIIEPYNVDDATFAKAWQEKKYQGLGFNESDNTEFFSEKGERMRSKSEVLIANALCKRGIPYCYECPILLPGGIVKYPDFTVLNVKKRKVYYWEHLGKMGDMEYVASNVKKLFEYKKVGIWIGKNLILTFETSEMPLGTKEIELIIDELLV